jgi:hypothetical protein
LDMIQKLLLQGLWYVKPVTSESWRRSQGDSLRQHLPGRSGVSWDIVAPAEDEWKLLEERDSLAYQWEDGSQQVARVQALIDKQLTN